MIFSLSCRAITSIFVAILFVAPVCGQQRPLPNDGYYLPFIDYYQADYRSAGKDFTRGETSAFKFGTQRYLDSICFWTMMGECQYQLGNYADAIVLYEQSLNLYLYYQTLQWQARLQAPPVIQVDNTIATRVRINWGTPTRQALIPRMPDSFGVLFGQLDSERALQQGGVVQNAEVKQINLNEIMRCTALSIHRRRLIKGPTSKYDPFSVKLLDGLRGAAVNDGTLIGAYNGVLLGLAQASVDEWDAAAETLGRSLQFNGGMDHTLTPVALMELANIGIETDNFAAAGKFALEASFSAATFYQYDLIEEALTIGAKVHMIQVGGAYPPLQPAILWANREKARQMQASLMVRLAECLAEAGQPALASEAVAQIKSVINSRNSLANTSVASRLGYLSALVRFQNADFVNGMSELTVALAGFQRGSLWLYRLALADNLTVAGNIGERQADLLYGALLRDPSDRDWKLDPLESMSFLASNHVGPMERWFDIVVNRKDLDRAISIAELIRRHRFFSQLPLGGRLLSFRWVLHAPIQALPNNALQQRKDFFAKNTQYQQWTDRAEQLRTALLLLPLKPESGTPPEKEQTKLLAELGEVSNLQEAYLASFALRREPADMVFPPQVELSEFRENIAEDQLALVTLMTANGYHLFFVNGNSVKYIGLSRERDIQRIVAGLLKKIGAMDASLDISTLQADWKTTATESTKKLLGEISTDDWKKVRELVIVPDGLLWYLPFELLQVGEGAEQQNLFDAVEIRYSPTLYLGFRNQRPYYPIARTAAVAAKIHLRLDAEVSANAFKELSADLPTAVAYEKSTRAPSNLLGSLFDQLVVWSEVNPTRNASLLDIHPMQIDQGLIGSTLGGWMTLPWYGPEHVTMPGFISDGGLALRGKLNGTDLFLTTTALMGAGTRTLLISRWRVGGANSLALSRNYARRLPTMPGGLALRESVAAARQLDLNYELEPQIRTKKNEPVLKAEHPYFWAGLMRFEVPAEQPPAPAVPPPAADGGVVVPAPGVAPAPAVIPPAAAEKPMDEKDGVPQGDPKAGAAEPKVKDPQGADPQPPGPKKVDPKKDDPKKEEPKKEDPIKKIR